MNAKLKSSPTETNNRGHIDNHKLNRKGSTLKIEYKKLINVSRVKGITKHTLCSIFNFKIGPKLKQFVKN